MIAPMRDPVTEEEWAEAVDAAVLMLGIEAARQYGLIIGGPEVVVERCELILERASGRGIDIPALEAVVERPS